MIVNIHIEDNASYMRATGSGIAPYHATLIDMIVPPYSNMEGEGQNELEALADLCGQIAAAFEDAKTDAMLKTGKRETP